VPNTAYRPFLRTAHFCPLFHAGVIFLQLSVLFCDLLTKAQVLSKYEVKIKTYALMG